MQVFMEPLARTLDRVYDECGSVLPTPVADAMNYLSSRPMSASTTAPVAVSTAVTTAVTATPSDGAPAVAEPEAKRVRVESFSQGTMVL
ncbi:MAG: hypothetical protein P4L40_12265 [Terracidiphilus sp.]|nr:hypothetical protein [Terracidiphilus sp.]